MIHLTAQTRILLATKPADFRKGIDGLVAVCNQTLEQDTRSGIIFVFINRNKTMIRSLSYDGSGYWLMTKRLSKGKYQGWPTGESALHSVESQRLQVLLCGSSGGNKMSGTWQNLS